MVAQKKAPAKLKKQQPEQKVARLKRKAVFHPPKVTDGSGGKKAGAKNAFSAFCQRNSAIDVEKEGGWQTKGLFLSKTTLLFQGILSRNVIRVLSLPSK
ncbi:hypothetical protein [Hymenobacter daeguensis]